MKAKGGHAGASTLKDISGFFSPISVQVLLDSLVDSCLREANIH